jgi:hypothetical protein
MHQKLLREIKLFLPLPHIFKKGFYNGLFLAEQQKM